MMAETPPSVRGSDTSEAAAESMAESASDLRGRVLDLLRKHPEGLTTDEIEVLMKGRHQTISPRVWELEKRGLIGDTGKRRKTRSKRMARVMRALSPLEVQLTLRMKEQKR